MDPQKKVASVRVARPVAWLALLVWLLLLSAAQCQADGGDDRRPTPELPTPAPVLIPPIEPGDGSDLVDQLLARGIIRVGIRVWPEAEFSPPAFRGFSNAATGGALNGFEVDIARAVAENLGLELELIEAYPPVIASGDWRGEWDIALASLVPFDRPLEAETARSLVYSRPYGYMPMGILVPVGNEALDSSFAQLSGQRVGMLEHSAYQRLLTEEADQLTIAGKPLFVEATSDLQPVIISNLQKSIRQLGQAEADPETQVDAIFGPTPLLEEAVRSELPVRLAVNATNVGVQPLAIAAVPQEDLEVERLILEINVILERLRRQGDLAEIYLDWYGRDLSQPLQ
jgi:ABC-type amino acid transport substrate-binding protein